MTVFSDIQSALDARLNTMVGLPAVAWANAAYEPVLGTSFLRPTMLPAETFASTFKTDNNSGIYQIDVFAKAGVGSSAARLLADNVADHFKPVTELTYNSRLVRCVSVSQLAPRENTTNSAAAWYHIPIEIRYLSLTIKR